MNIQESVEREKEAIISFRRHFHRYPELSQQEKETMAYIETILHEWEIPTVRVAQGGIFGILDSGKPGKTLLMRADMDALPISESTRNLTQTRTIISEKEGVMHACGHDGHMAMLLGAAKILSEHKEEWSGKILLMFEEAEEMGERGIGHLLRYLRDQNIPVDYCYGTHVKWDVPVGKMGILYGAAMAGAYFFSVRIHGQGGHGSRPDMAHSPIEAFVSLANGLRAYRMRETNPADMFTYSFGTVQSGTAPNVIPDTLTFSGTARYMKNEDGLRFRDRLFGLLRQCCEDEGCRVEILDEQYAPVTENNETCVTLARKAVTEQLGAHVLDGECEAWAAAETFAITEAIYPGVFVFTGIADESMGSGAPHHTPAFDIGEEGLLTGAATGIAYALAILREQPDISCFVPADLEYLLHPFSDDAERSKRNIGEER